VLQRFRKLKRAFWENPAKVKDPMLLLIKIVNLLPSPLFTKNQLKMLATIFADLGQVAVAGIIIPFFMGNSELITAIVGLTFTLLSWVISLLISRERVWII
jgi:hypothetical protein